jgi:acyl-CoA thioester hydrolase
MKEKDFELGWEDFPHQTFEKVRYGDTDAQGHVNNAIFPEYLETGR